jgi:cytosine deaminase
MDLTLHNAILDRTLKPIHIGIQDGKISIVSESVISPGRRSIDAGGAMVSPPFIDSHFHLENAYLDGTPNISGTLQEAIEIYAEIKQKLDTPDIVRRTMQVARDAIANGTLWMRSHVDIDHIGKLRLLEGVLAAREAVKGFFDVQVIAFPQMGLAQNPEAVDYMWAAMESGADVVGGMPHSEKDMDDAARQIEIIFEIAKKYNADIDMHVDETDDPYWHSLELLAEKTIEEGYQGRVSAGHCCAMGSWDDALAERVIQKVKNADINIIGNIPINLYLEGRHDSHPFRRGIPRLRDLVEAGVNVALGQDDVRNMFYPFGKLDMLEVANFAAHAAQLSTPSQIQATFDMPRYNAARTLRLPEYGIQEGYPANLILIDAQSPTDAIRRQPERLLVVRQGEILVESKRSVTYSTKIATPG